MSERPGPMPGLIRMDGLEAGTSLSRTTLENFILEGLPCYDLATHDPRRRTKRLLLFDLAECVGWIKANKKFTPANGNGSAE